MDENIIISSADSELANAVQVIKDAILFKASSGH